MSHRLGTIKYGKEGPTVWVHLPQPSISNIFVTLSFRSKEEMMFDGVWASGVELVSAEHTEHKIAREA